MIVVALPETYAPAILAKKARSLREKTGDLRYQAPLDLEKTSFVHTAKQVLGRPWKVFFKEGILVVITIYMSVSGWFFREVKPCAE